MFCSTGNSRDARGFRRWHSKSGSCEVMLRTPAFLLRRRSKRIRGQISSPLFFFSPGRELRPWLCRDRRHEQGLGRSAGTGEPECQRTRRVQEQLALQRTRKGGEEEEEGEEDAYVRGTRRFLSALCFITQPSKHSFGPPSGWPFYLLPSFPRWAASTHNLLPFHVWSAVEEDEGLVQVKINEVVYMAYARQETGIPFLFFFFFPRWHPK